MILLYRLPLLLTCMALRDQAASYPQRHHPITLNSLSSFKIKIKIACLFVCLRGPLLWACSCSRSPPVETGHFSCSWIRVLAFFQAPRDNLDSIRCYINKLNWKHNFFLISSLSLNPCWVAPPGPVQISLDWGPITTNITRFILVSFLIFCFLRATSSLRFVKQSWLWREMNVFWFLPLGGSIFIWDYLISLSQTGFLWFLFTFILKYCRYRRLPTLHAYKCGFSLKHSLTKCVQICKSHGKWSRPLPVSGLNVVIKSQVFLFSYPITTVSAHCSILWSNWGLTIDLKTVKETVRELPCPVSKIHFENKSRVKE